MNRSPATDAIVYIGTYTQTLPHVQGKAEGIYVYRLDRDTGVLHYLSMVPQVVNPSFLALDPQGRYLYAVQEVDQHAGQPGGAASSFVVDPATHGLAPHPSSTDQSTHGAFPCYIHVDHTGRWLLVANHGGGNVAVLPIADNGALGPATAVVQHETSGSTPHPHSIVVDPANRYVLVADAGLDRIVVYRLDTERGALIENDVPWTALPGTGPRHLAFHPDGSYLYCITERGSTVTAFAYEADKGILHELQTVTTLPDGFEGRNACADIQIHPSGRFLYGSNRGHNSIACFTLDPATGRLERAGHAATGGRTPRSFGINSTGTFLLAANQDTDTVVTFRIDPATGALTAAGPSAAIPTPVCVRIVDVHT